MELEQLHSFCLKEIEDYVYELPESALGNAFPSEKVNKLLEKAKASLVIPYKTVFDLRDTYDQIMLSKPISKEFWVVAKSGSYFVFYDVENNEFGLAEEIASKAIPSTIGVRGDFVGTFMAI